MDEERKFDPVTPAAKDDIRPDFLGGGKAGDSGGGLGGNTASDKSGGGGRAANDLKEAEESASGGLFRSEGGLSDARNLEEGSGGSGGYFRKSETTNKVATAAKMAKDIKKGKFSGVFKKGGPAVGLLMIIFLVGGIFAGTQAFQVFSLVEQFRDNYNSMFPSAKTRADVFFMEQMKKGRTKDPVVGNKIFGYDFKLSDYQIDQLKRQGVEYDAEGKTLKYTDAGGTEKTVTADNFKEVYASDAEFFRKYNAGSMTWRGQFANWYGNTVTNFLKRNKMTRNMFQDFRQKRDAAGGDGMKAFKNLLYERITNKNSMKLKVAEEDSNDDKGYSAKEESVSEKNVTDKLDKIKTKFSSGANAGCAVAGVIGAINALVVGSEALQIINLTTSFSEAADKAKAGYGADAPINEVGQALNEKMENKNDVVETTGVAYAGDSSFDGSGGINTLQMKTYTTNKTAMSSEGIASLFSGKRGNPTDPSVLSFNIVGNLNPIMSGLGTSVEAFKLCTVARVGAATVSLGLTGLEIAACIAGVVGAPISFGATAAAGCGPLIADTIIGVAASVAIGVAVAGVVSLLTPAVSQLLTRDLVTNMGGEDLGNALASGSLMYLGGAHRANGGSLSNVQNYEQFAVARQQVLAEKARMERESLSPFDLTSSNTFLGSIMRQMMTFVNSDSVMNKITSAGTVMSSSIASLTPSASAVAVQIADTLPDMDEYAKTCPYLASIGAVGDLYCNPYTITDISTIEDDPADVIDEVDALSGSEPNFKSSGGGKIKINNESRLAKYIRYCSNRSSSFGTTDYTIVDDINKATTVSSGKFLTDAVGNSFIGSFPIVGDVVDFFEGGNNLNYLGYISGESCVAGNDMDAADSPDWREAKYYQRFIEDQSLAESMGLVEKSAVAEYLEEYYEENPLDNSYEGVLARYSGLDKETVSDLLDIIAYYNYINDYDPSERYAFGAPVVDSAELEPMFDHENVMDGTSIALEGVIYSDLRNRNYAV